MPPDLAFVTRDAMGGVTTVVANLIRQCPLPGFTKSLVLTRESKDTATPVMETLAVNRQVRFGYNRDENMSVVVRRLARAMPSASGVLVANDWLELAMCVRHHPQRSVVFTLHGDYPYYYQLARHYEGCIDTFIAPSRRIHEKLLEALPHCAERVAYIPHGVSVDTTQRIPAPGPLRLLYVGRVIQHQKSVLDLPVIDGHLAAKGIGVKWTIVGDGPDRARLCEQWADPDRVTYAGALPQEEVLRLYRDHDCLVLPSREEGLPLCLLEAMAAGVVPVVSDLPSGIREVVEDGITGFRIPPGEAGRFAAAITRLAQDPALVTEMGQNARQLITNQYDLAKSAQQYAALFARWHELKQRRRKPSFLIHSSRLDHVWIPNFVVRALRQMRQKMLAP